MKVGVIIGRFQTHDLHDGHIDLLNYVINNHDQTLVLIGCRDSLPNKDNPLNYLSRELMIKSKFQEVLTAPIMDHLSDRVWSKNVDRLIRSFFPFSSVTIYGGRDSFIPHYLGTFETKELHFASLSHGDNSTEGREALNYALSSSDFRKGVIYHQNSMIKRTYMTVDVAMLKDGKALMGKKEGERLYRFPGGFVDFEDGDLEEAAKRELSEETKMYSSCLKYLGSFSINDWRNSSDSKIMTAFFVCDYEFGKPEAGDDLEEVEWVSLDTSLVIKNHKNLMVRLINELNS